MDTTAEHYAWSCNTLQQHALGEKPAHKFGPKELHVLELKLVQQAHMLAIWIARLEQKKKRRKELKAQLVKSAFEIRETRKKMRAYYAAGRIASGILAKFSSRDQMERHRDLFLALEDTRGEIELLRQKLVRTSNRIRRLQRAIATMKRDARITVFY